MFSLVVSSSLTLAFLPKSLSHRLSISLRSIATSKMSNSNSTNSSSVTKNSPLISSISDEFHLDALDLYNRLKSCDDETLSPAISSALTVLGDAIRLYGPSHVVASYNGGKDADVVMHLMRAAVARFAADNNKLYRPGFIYFAVKEEFPEVLEHLKNCQKTFNLNIKKYECGIAQGITDHIMTVSSAGAANTSTMNPEFSTATVQQGCLAFVLGTRRGDPNCGDQQEFSPSSSWMPPFMRVNPVITWNYGQVWNFLRYFNLPYCKLYDHGYTSLGKKTDTRPNPALLIRATTSMSTCMADLEGEVDESYLPAYMLSDWTLERAGRGAPAATSTSSTITTTSSSSSSSSSARSYGSSQDDELLGTDSAMCSINSGGQKKVSTRVASDAGTHTPSGDHVKSIIRRAGMVVIGDEILNGFTADVNVQVASKALSSIGIPLKRVTIVSDDVIEIADEVRRMSKAFDIVITSGGIGPTHDDVTLKAVADALGVPIAESTDMMEHLKRVQSIASSRGASVSDPASSSAPPAAGDYELVKMDEATRRLAQLPSTSRLRFAPNGYPYPNPLPIPSANPKDDVGQQLPAITWPVLQCDNIFILPGK